MIMAGGLYLDVCVRTIGLEKGLSLEHFPPFMANCLKILSIHVLILVATLKSLINGVDSK